MLLFCRVSTKFDDLAAAAGYVGRDNPAARELLVDRVFELIDLLALETARPTPPPRTHRTQDTAADTTPARTLGDRCRAASFAVNQTASAPAPAPSPTHAMFMSQAYRQHRPRGLSKVGPEPAKLSEGTRAFDARDGRAQTRDFRRRRPPTNHAPHPKLLSLETA